VEREDRISAFHSPGHEANLYSATYSPDGKHIVTASNDETARVWDARTGQELKNKKIQGSWMGISSAAYSPDGRYIVTAHLDTTVRLWDAMPARQLAVLTGHTTFPWNARFSPDSKQIVTAGSDRTARVWDVQTEWQLAVLEGILTSSTAQCLARMANRS